MGFEASLCFCIWVYLNLGVCASEQRTCTLGNHLKSSDINIKYAQDMYRSHAYQRKLETYEIEL